MQEISGSKLAEILSVPMTPVDVTITGVSTDSRHCSASDVFIAVKGENFDGHDFVPQVIKNGCPIVIVERPIEGVEKSRQLIVRDTLEAYGKIGAYVRSQFKGIVIGLTGSSGKTTTKEEIRFILSHFGKVYATAGNHNNFVGVPESLCHMDMAADYAVIEMGMSSKGEISRLTSYVKPDIAVITNVYPMHLEFFDSYKGIAEAKSEIFEGLKAGGIAIINEDSDFADLLLQKAQEATSNIYQFGKNTHPDVIFETAQEGEHHRYNAWCVLTVVQALDLDVKKAAVWIKDFGALDGRGKHHQLNLPQGKGSYTLIDDSYSGQPQAMKFAIKSLEKMKTNGRKIAVLGKMAELGEASEKMHMEIGDTLADTNIDIVIGVCPEMKDMLARLPERIQQYYFENKDAVAQFLTDNLLKDEDVVLIKGARYSSKLYQTTKELLEKGAA